MCQKSFNRLCLAPGFFKTQGRGVRRIVGLKCECYNLGLVKVSEIGEFALIDYLSEITDRAQRSYISNDTLLIGIGDDAACWRGEGPVELASVDSLIEGVHFTMDNWSWHDVGWKAMAISLSDIAAMGSWPRYCLVGLTLPGEAEVDSVGALYKGMLDLAGLYHVAIVGGNTSSAPIITVTTSIFGYSKGNIMCRSSARPGDKIAVTGTLGGAAACLRLLKAGATLLPEFNAFKEAFFHPKPRVSEGQFLADLGVKTAIDISDGLASDLNHICKDSGVAARVAVDSIPLAPGLKEFFGEEALDLALGGGEDYELIFTAPSETMSKVLKEASFKVTVVGDILPGQGISFLGSEGKMINVRMAGWEHFSSAAK